MDSTEDPGKMLSSLFKALGLISSGPRNANPKDFATSAKITDDECLLGVTKALELNRRQQALQRELNLVSQEANVANGRLFNSLRKKYPHVQTENIPESQVGLRKWEGDWYFVGWEEDE